MNKIRTFFLLLMSFAIYASEEPEGGIGGRRGRIWRKMLYGKRFDEMAPYICESESSPLSVKKSSLITITLDQWRASKLSDDSGSKQISSSFDFLEDSKAKANSNGSFSEVADEVKAFLMKEGDEV